MVSTATTSQQVSSKPLRQLGRDEMNLAEFPITLLTDRVPKDQKEAIYQDEIYDERTGLTLSRKLIISAGNHGLTTAIDDEVILALIQMTKSKNNYTDRRVEFSRHELIQLLNWPRTGASYERILLSLKRWTSVFLQYENAWRDNRTKSWVSAGFHIIDNYEITDSRLTDEQLDLIPSYIIWNKVIFESFQAGYLKPLDYDLCMGLSNSTAKRMYRFLDKRFHHKPDWTFDLKELAHEHIGLGRNYEGPAHLKRNLRPAIEELESIGFLEPLPDSERFPKDGRNWKIRLIQKAPALPANPASQQPTLPLPEPKPPCLVTELANRGVTRATAAELVRQHPAEAIRGEARRVRLDGGEAGQAGGPEPGRLPGQVDHRRLCAAQGLRQPCRASGPRGGPAGQGTRGGRATPPTAGGGSPRAGVAGRSGRVPRAADPRRAGGAGSRGAGPCRPRGEASLRGGRPGAVPGRHAAGPGAGARGEGARAGGRPGGGNVLTLPNPMPRALEARGGLRHADLADADGGRSARECSAAAVSTRRSGRSGSARAGGAGPAARASGWIGRPGPCGSTRRGRGRVRARGGETNAMPARRAGPGGTPARAIAPEGGRYVIRRRYNVLRGTRASGPRRHRPEGTAHARQDPTPPGPDRRGHRGADRRAGPDLGPVRAAQRFRRHPPRRRAGAPRRGTPTPTPSRKDPTMTIDRIREALTVAPFVAFDLRLVDGRHFTITHPDYLTIPPARRPRDILVFTTRPEGPNDEYRTHRIDAALIVEITTPATAEATAPPVGDGA